MIGSSHGSGSTVPSLSHQEAEGLISARLDGPISVRQEQALAAHLATCAHCRQFAGSMSMMTVGFREIPRLPASPIVSRQVRERINQPRSVWDRLGAMFAGRMGLASVAASAAALIILVGAWSLLNNNSGGVGSHDATVAAGTQSTDLALISDPTVTTAPRYTATIAPGIVRTPQTEQPTLPNIRADDPTATEITAPESTATDTTGVLVAELPTSTERPTVAPTATDEPSATDTATAEPTETAVPTNTAAPTQTRVPTKTATDEPTATEKPSATARPTRTATEEPTDDPTATEKPRKPTATDTAAPTDTPVPADTATEEPAGPPTIAPSDDSAPTVDDSAGDTVEPTVDTGSSGDSTLSDLPTETSVPDSGGDTIEPIGTDIVEAPTEDTGIGGETVEPTEASVAAAGNDQTDAGSALDDTDRVTGLQGSGGAPNGPLWINTPQSLMVLSADAGGMDLQVVTTADGHVLTDLGAAAYPLWSPQGIVLLYQDLNGAKPQAALYESDNGQAGPISVENDDDYVEEVPAGWNGTTAYYLRVLGDSDSTVVLYGYDVNSGDTYELWRATGINLSDTRPISTNDGFLIATTDQWLFIGMDGSQSELGANSLGVSGPAVLSPFGTLIAYSTGSQIVIAPVDSPGSPQGAPIPYAPGPGAGFSWEPGGNDLVVSDGASLTIYDNKGNVLGVVGSTTGVSLAGPQWLPEGIYYVETSPNPSYRLLITAKIPGYAP